MTSRQHIILLVDNSWSMKQFFPKITEGINNLIYKLRAERSNVRLSLITFSDRSKNIWMDIHISNLLLIHPSTFDAVGGTALYDAVGDILSQFHPQDGTHVTLYIVTDGEDNCSSRYSKENIDNLLEQATGTGHWTVIFCDTEVRDLQLKAVRHVVYRQENIDELFAGMSI